jgi:MFS family permease
MTALGVGWFGILFFWAFYSGTMPLFLSEFTNSKFIISLVLSLAGVSGSIVPPIVGYLSDRTASRYGRRRPYIFFGILIMAVCFAGLPHLRLFIPVIIISAILYVSVDVAQTPFMSLLPDITPPQQRGIASGTMSFFGNVGLIACFFLSSKLWEHYRVTLFYLVSLVSAGCTLTAIALLKEPKPPVSQFGEAANPFIYFRSIMKERESMKFFLAQFFWWLGCWTAQSFLTLFMVESLRIAEGDALFVLLVMTAVQTAFVLPFGILGDRIDRKKLLSCMVVLWTVVECSIGFSQNFTHALLLVAITGIPLAAVTGVGYAFMLDLIPSERTAEFVGIGLISMAAPQIFGPLIGGALIDLLGYRYVFPVAAAFILVAVPLILSIHSEKKEARELYHV